jgi:hypothetical protein
LIGVERRRHLIAQHERHEHAAERQRRVEIGDDARAVAGGEVEAAAAGGEGVPRRVAEVEGELVDVAQAAAESRRAPAPHAFARAQKDCAAPGEAARGFEQRAQHLDLTCRAIDSPHTVAQRGQALFAPDLAPLVAALGATLFSPFALSLGAPALLRRRGEQLDLADLIGGQERSDRLGSLGGEGARPAVSARGARGGAGGSRRRTVRPAPRSDVPSAAAARPGTCRDLPFVGRSREATPEGVIIGSHRGPVKLARTRK